VLQGQVVSDHGWLVVLSRPDHSGGDAPGVEVIRVCVHKQRALNTQLSSGTSAGTFAVSAGPYTNYRNEAGTKNEPDTYFVPVQKKGWKIDPYVSDLVKFFFKGFRSKISWISFSRGSGPHVCGKRSKNWSCYRRKRAKNHEALRNQKGGHEPLEKAIHEMWGLISQRFFWIGTKNVSSSFLVPALARWFM